METSLTNGEGAVFVIFKHSFKVMVWVSGLGLLVKGQTRLIATEGCTAVHPPSIYVFSKVCCTELKYEAFEVQHYYWNELSILSFKMILSLAYNVKFWI